MVFGYGHRRRGDPQMDKREFLKTSGAMLASTLLSKLTSAQTTPDIHIRGYAYKFLST
jgi:hypothetical protein